MSEASGILGPGGPDAWHRFGGRTVGAIFLAGFGAYSMYWWTLAAIQTGRQGWFYAIAAITAIFLAWSIAQLAIFRHVSKPDFDKRYRRFYATRFGVILTIEVAAIFLGGPVLGHFQRKDLIPQWVDVVVGFHFLPLGKLFKLPLYYATASVILLSSLGSLLIPPSSLRFATNAGGTALALWTTSYIILGKNPSYLPAKTVPGVSSVD
jgi:putative flippase GtrA